MVSYKTVEHKAKDGRIFVFVTRGKSAPFSSEEIAHFLSDTQVAPEKSKAQVVAEELSAKLLANGQYEGVTPRPLFAVPKEREKLFLADLRCGIEFCTKKYGASEKDILNEARRVFPSLNLEKLWEKKDGSKG